MSRHRFEAYLDKVFGFSQLVSALPEGRESPQHSWKRVFDAVFRIPSLLQIGAACRGGALAKRIGPISDDTLGYASKVNRAQRLAYWFVVPSLNTS